MYAMSPMLHGRISQLVSWRRRRKTEASSPWHEKEGVDRSFASAPVDKEFRRLLSSVLPPLSLPAKTPAPSPSGESGPAPREGGEDERLTR